MWNLPDDNYRRYVIKPYLETRFSTVERLHLPMIDLSYSMQNAVPPYIWGLLWKNWEPSAAEGNTVFLEDYSARGPENYKKKIYYSGVTPDLFREKFRGKVCRFFQRLFAEDHSGFPLMRLYLNSYFDLYWDLHLGSSGKDIPFYAEEIAQSFNECLANVDPFESNFYQNFMKVRELRESLDQWINHRLCQIEGGEDGAEKTIAYYWLENGRKAEGTTDDSCEAARTQEFKLERRDVVFECFHNFVALNQWGNTIYNIMDKLRVGGDPEVRGYFFEMVESGLYDEKDGSRFTRLDRFIMELFRTIMPNGGSISTQATPSRRREGQVFTTHDHVTISNDPIHWENPEKFDPDRYKGKPTSDDVDEKECSRLGFEQCPFSKQDVVTTDGRGKVTNSGFGTVYNEDKNGTAHPVLDYAGYGPFGFGYRRCPGELFTVEVIKEFLCQIIENNIEFNKLDRKPEKVPVAPGTIVEDDIGFTKRSGKGFSPPSWYQAKCD